MGRLSCADPEYFRRYAGSGKNYNRVWNQYSYASEMVHLLKSDVLRPLPKKLLILGAATGKVPAMLEKRLPVKCWGCEINAWAYAQIPSELRRRVSLMDMRHYVDELVQREKKFDLAFSNSLIYLPKSSLRPFLKKLSRVTKSVHFNSSFKGHAARDPYRKITETYDWWNENFQRVGFMPLRLPRGRRSYLWTLES